MYYMYNSRKITFVSNNLGTANCNTITNTWGTGRDSVFNLHMNSTITSWNAEVTFDKAITTLYVYQGSGISCSGGNVCTFANQVIFSCST